MKRDKGHQRQEFHFALNMCIIKQHRTRKDLNTVAELTGSCRSQHEGSLTEMVLAEAFLSVSRNQRVSGKINDYIR